MDSYHQCFRRIFERLVKHPESTLDRDLSEAGLPSGEVHKCAQIAGTMLAEAAQEVETIKR